MFLLWPCLGRRILSLYRLRIPRRTAQLTVLNGDYAWIVALDKVFSPGLTTERGILDTITNCSIKPLPVEHRPRPVPILAWGGYRWRG